MGNNKKSPFFQLVRHRGLTPMLALLVLILVVLIPAHLFQAGRGRTVELIRTVEGKQNYKLFQIYSLLKSEMMDLKDALTWAISKTILEESSKHSFDPMLVLAIINVESGFQHEAVSADGARGLMQIRPFVADALAQDLGLPFNPSTFKPLNLDDPILNIKLGVFYLHYLKKSFRDLKLALTAYNWGPTQVKNFLEEDEPVPLEYAMKVLSAYRNYRQDSRQRETTP